MTENPQPHHQNQPEEVHLSDYIKVILRRRKSFLLISISLFVGVVLYTFTMKPIYEASATVHVNDEKAKQGVLAELALMNSANPIDSEVEILKSRTNMEEVVRRLNLDRVVVREVGTPSVKVLECDVADRRSLKKYLLNFTGPDTYTVTEGQTVIAAGKKGVPLQSGGMRILVGAETSCRNGDVAGVALLPFQATVESLRQAVKAAEVGKKTNVIRVSYQSRNPEKARDVVNTLVQVYLERTVGFKAEEASKTVTFIEDQLKGLRDDLEKSATNLQAYKSATGVISLDNEAKSLVDKLTDAEKDRASVTLQKKQAEFALASLKEAKRRGAEYSPSLMRDDPGVAAMAGRLAELQIQKNGLLSQQTENHPEVRGVQAQIDELQRKIQATYETAVRTASNQEAEITRRLNLFEGKMRGLPATERDLARLERVTKVNADIYTLLLNKHEEARIARAATISNINIVDPAIAPDNPIKPQKKKNILLGLLVGCMVGVGFAFFRDYMDDTLKDPEDAKRVLGIPLLGVIPFMKEHEGENGALDAGMLLQPKSAGAEAFRSVRTALHFSSAGAEAKVLLVTSSFPGEGKSTVSSNLGILLAQTGMKVLLVDCDLRRPSLHQKFGHSKVPGLTEIITGDATISTAIHSTGIPSLDFISAGTIPPNPAELLGSGLMSDFMDKVRGEYDRIILDAPPVLAVTDTPVLSPLSDQALVVVEAERVPAKAAKRLREILHDTGMRCPGFVFNDKANRGETYGYYGYGYYGYYGYGDSSEPVSETVTGKFKRWIGRAGRGSGRKPS
jgi:capsular exopolysaccharide synthesis family protein